MKRNDQLEGDVMIEREAQYQEIRSRVEETELWFMRDRVIGILQN